MRVVGLDHPLTLTCVNSLAIVVFSQGSLVTARMMFSAATTATAAATTAAATAAATAAVTCKRLNITVHFDLNCLVS